MAKLSRKNFSPQILPFVRKFLRPRLRKIFLSPERIFCCVNLLLRVKAKIIKYFYKRTKAHPGYSMVNGVMV